MKTITLIAAVTLASATAAAAAGPPHTLQAGSWVCSSPEAYDQAVVEQAQWQRGLEALKANLLERKLCMYVDIDYIDRMMAPWVVVDEQRAGKAHVSFTVDFRERIAFLHRKITRITYAGWTDIANLRGYYDE